MFKKPLLLLLGLLGLSLFTTAQEDVIVGSNPRSVSAVLTKDVSSVTDVLATAAPRPRTVIDRNKNASEDRPTLINFNPNFIDPAKQRYYEQPDFALTPPPACWEGIDSLASLTRPPDPTIAAGPFHLIQMTNNIDGAMYRVYSKAGAILAEGLLGDLTGVYGYSDPIVLWDQFVSRWVMIEIPDEPTLGQWAITMAVSKTADPLGGWWGYMFPFGTELPDYPKLGVWPGGWFGSAKIWGSDGTILAFDKNKLINGNGTNALQIFNAASGNLEFVDGSICAATMHGSKQPFGITGGLSVALKDDPSDQHDSLIVYECRPNFNNAALSVVVRIAALETAPYNGALCNSVNCVPQPSTAIPKLRALDRRVMNQPVYRRFGTYEGLAITHTVNKGGGIAAARWYELRKTTNAFTIAHQSTYTPDDVNRWLPTISYDANGSISLAYNVADAVNVFPGLRRTGRAACDPVNQMTIGEKILTTGLAANSNARYGDYNHLTIDPSGSLFWVTGEWNKIPKWTTAICSYVQPGCPPPACAAPSNIYVNSITTGSALLQWSVVNGATSYTVMYRQAGSPTWINLGNIAGNSITVTGLLANTTYQWQVASNCSNGSSSLFAYDQFTTAVCNDPGEPNNTFATASNYLNNSNLNARLNEATDIDYYKFTTSSTFPHIKATLFNLPANYDLTLYSPTNVALAISANPGTSDELIKYNNGAPGTYRIRVASKTGQFNSTLCYTLNVQLSNNPWQRSAPRVEEEEMLTLAKIGPMKLYPQPAREYVTIAFDAEEKGSRNIEILNESGTRVWNRTVQVNPGINFYRVDLKNMPKGIYVVKLSGEKASVAEKMIIQ